MSLFDAHMHLQKSNLSQLLSSQHSKTNESAIAEICSFFLNYHYKYSINVTVAMISNDTEKI